MVLLIDFAYDVPASFQEGKGLIGGFTMRTINTSRLCFSTISQACLKVKGPDVRLFVGAGVASMADVESLHVDLLASGLHVIVHPVAKVLQAPGVEKSIWGPQGARVVMYHRYGVSGTRVVKAESDTPCSAAAIQVCVNEAIDELLKGTAPYDPSYNPQQQGASRHSSAWVVAVAVPIAVVAVLLLAAAGVAWVVCRRHRKQQKQQEAGYRKSQTLASDSATGGGSRSLLGGPESGCGSSREHGDEDG
jgi:hypothetical protein